MLTKPYKEEITTSVYALRIGRKVPSNAANLAYVNSPSISPQDNLVVEDYSDRIPENTNWKISLPRISLGSIQSFLPGRIPKFRSYYLAKADDSFLLHYNGGTKFPSDNVEITDEFSVVYSLRQEPEPLFYKTTLRNYFNVTDVEEVIQYKNGYSILPVYDFTDKPLDRTKPMIYLGNKISIKINNDTSLPSSGKYKVVLIPTNNPAKPGECTVTIYSNFRNKDIDTYFVTYQKYDDKSASTVEVLNLEPFFGRVPMDDIVVWSSNPRPGGEWLPELDNKVYSVEYLSDSNMYQFYVPTQVIIADDLSRSPQTFTYQVEANLDVTYSVDNPVTLNIGMHYNLTHNDVSYKDTRMSMFNLLNYLPSYVQAQNPFPPYNHIDQKDYLYWTADISQPGDILKKYNIIIISGYGALDLAHYGQSLIDYMNNGGKVWIDSCSDGLGALSLSNWPAGAPTGVTFDTLNSSTGYKCAVDTSSKYISRYYVIPTADADNQIAIGYSEVDGPVGAKILIDESETSRWTNVIRWSNVGQDAAITFRKIGNGALIISNCGVMRSAMENDDIAMKFFVNSILALAEDIWIKTPKTIEQVIHIDNLYPADYIQDGQEVYYKGYMSAGSSTLVARKAVAPTVKEAVLPFIPHKYHNGTGTFRVSCDNSNVVMTEESDGSEKLWAYSLVAGNNTFDLNGTGLDEYDITTFYPSIDFKWSITSYTYEWDNVAEYRYIEGQTYTSSSVLAKTDGRLTLNTLTSVLPGIPQGGVWKNPSKVFYKLWLGEMINGQLVESSIPVNMAFYNTKTGEYIYDLSGENVIRWHYLFTEDQLKHIVIHAWTDHYTLRAAKRAVAIRNNNNNRIFVSPPATDDERDCWYIRVHNGKFNRNFHNGNRTSTPEMCTYEIPEYDRQHFDPAGPWMKVNDDRAQYVDDHRVRLNQGKIKLGNAPNIFGSISLVKRKYPNSLINKEKLSKVSNYVFGSTNTFWLSSPAPILELQNPDGGYAIIPVEAYTIDYAAGTVTFKLNLPDHVFATYRYTEETGLTVTDIDVINGILTVAEEVDYTDEIFVDYYYEEEFYVYKGYWDGNFFWNLDLNPSEGHVTLYPLPNESGSTTPTLVPSSELINKSIYVYMLPHIVNAQVKTSWTIRHTFSETSLQSILTVEPRAFHIATIQVREKAKVEDIVVMDTRIRGGGLKDNISSARIQTTQPLAEHYWDIGPWDGLAYQNNGVIVIKLPKRLVTPDEKGISPMTDAQVREAISKYLPYGVFPIIEYVEIGSEEIPIEEAKEPVFLLPFMIGGTY